MAIKSISFEKTPIHDFMISMVRINGMAYRYFTKHSFPGLLEEAVRENPDAIKYAPPETKEWYVEFAEPVGVRQKTTLRFHADNINDLLISIQKQTSVRILDVCQVEHAQSPRHRPRMGS